MIKDKKMKHIVFNKSQILFNIGCDSERCYFPSVGHVVVYKKKVYKVISIAHDYDSEIISYAVTFLSGRSVP